MKDRDPVKPFKASLIDSALNLPNINLRGEGEGRFWQNSVKSPQLQLSFFKVHLKIFRLPLFHTNVSDFSVSNIMLED